jgi:NAD(P)-dependent dehydrogenase (short-subunit alcohol dehydrogenase family)
LITIDLSGRVALVTGGAQGIGLGIAQRLSAAGARVIIGDIQEKITKAVEEVAEAYIELDVTDPASIAACRNEIQNRFDRLDILVNNAGVAHFAGIADTELEDWRRVFAVDVEGVYLMSRACLPLLERSEGRGVVIQIASIHASLTVAGMSAYSAAKGAVVSLVRSMAQEFGARGIRVCAVSPGFVDTPLYCSWRDSEPDPVAAEARVIDQIPTRHIATPHEIGDAVVFLSSDLARSITGINLLIDGGLATRLMH